MSWLPPGDRHASGGERLDNIAHNAVTLAFRVLDRFPGIVKRHKYIAGGAAISSSLIALAGVAVARRMRGGATAEEAVNAVTEEEISGLRLVSDREVTVNLQAAEADVNGAASGEGEEADQPADQPDTEIDDADDSSEGSEPFRAREAD